MKRLKTWVCLIVATVMLITCATPVAAFLPEDKLMSSLKAKQDLLIQEQTRKIYDTQVTNSAISFGKNLSETMDVSAYINRKVMTKLDWEAFKWSFVFSQFASPLEDNMASVFNQTLFLEMEEQDFNITSVAESLQNAGITITDADIMLTSTNYIQLRDTIRNNLVYLTLYDEAGTSVKFRDLFDKDMVGGKVLYMYDTELDIPNLPTADQKNRLYYNQQELGLNDRNLFGSEQQELRIPALPLDNMVLFYLQIAVGTYCEAHDITLADLLRDKGGANVYIDSYGNTCMYDGSTYSIVIPNFGNPLLSNALVSDGQGFNAEERLNIYNKWVGTVYTKQLRSSNQIQDEVPSIVSLSESPTAYYNRYVWDGDDQTDLKNHLVLMKQPGVLPGSRDLIDILFNDYNLSSVDSIYSEVQDAANTSIDTGIIGPFAGWLDWAQPVSNVLGIIFSPTEFGRIPENTGTPFIGINGHKDQFPIIQPEAYIYHTDALGSVYDRFKSMLKRPVWTWQNTFVTSNTEPLISVSGNNFSFKSGTGDTLSVNSNKVSPNTRDKLISTLNYNTTAVFSFPQECTLPQDKYIASYSEETGYKTSTMFLRSSIIDYGQDMSVYLGERGMFLPEYAIFYSGTDTELAASLSKGAAEASRVASAEQAELLSTIASATTNTTSYSEFKEIMLALCEESGEDPVELLCLIINHAQKPGILSGLTESFRYFLPQYYYTSRDNRLSGKPGAQTIDDIALVMYFWDRYYIPQTTISRAILSTYNIAYKQITGKTYDELDNDEVMILPWEDENSTTAVRCYYYPYEEVFYHKFSAEDEWMIKENGGLPNTVISFKYSQFLLALQRNTNFTKNFINIPIESEIKVKGAEPQEVMDAFMFFIKNPVVALSNILAGFLHTVHRIVGIGDMGSIFTLQAMTNTGIYQWLREYGFVICLIAIVIILVINLFMYLIKRNMSFMELLTRCGKIVFCSMVPLWIINSFVFVFAAASTSIMSQTMDAVLLAETQIKTGERINSDAAVEGEIQIFKQQFAGLQSNYSGLLIEYPLSWDVIEKELITEPKAVSALLDDLKYTTQNEYWYDTAGFVPVHRDKYDESLFYFYYDYLKSEYIRYYANNTKSENGALSSLTSNYRWGNGITTTGEDSDTAVKEIQTLEQELAKIPLKFGEMMKDPVYVYGPSALVSNNTKYVKPYMRDLFGLYLCMADATSALDDATNIQLTISQSPYWKAYQNSNILRYGSGTDMDSRYYNQPSVIERTTALRDGLTRDFLVTSYLDIFENSVYSDTYRDGKLMPDITPFEQSLMRLNSSIYNKIIALCDILPTSISDEALIAASALIATFETNDMFGVKPDGIAIQSIDLDKYMRIMMASDASDIVSNNNLMYMLCGESYGVFYALMIVVMECIQAVNTIIRFVIIFVVAGLAFIFIFLAYGIGARKTSTRLLFGMAMQYGLIMILHILNLAMFSLFIGLNITTPFLKFISLSLMIIVSLASCWGYVYLIRALATDLVGLGANMFKETIGSIKATAAKVVSSLGTFKLNAGAYFESINAKIADMKLAVQQASASVESAVLTIALGKISQTTEATQEAQAAVDSFMDYISQLKGKSTEEKVEISNNILGQ